MNVLYDVIVVGGGPAGATAAYFLGEAGQRVLVLERERVPRYKACGGGLSARMLAAVFPFPFDSVVETRVSTITYALGRHSVTLPIAGHGIQTVMRSEFDAQLLAHVRGEVRTGSGVRRVSERPDRVRVETTDGAVFEGRYLVGADGANSVVARDLGLCRPKRLAAALEAEVPADAETRRRLGDRLVIILGTPRYGYAWVFPKAEHLSIGLAGLHPRPGELQDQLAKLAARYGLSLAQAQIHGHPIPLYKRRERVGTARALLVGDAAGLVDPLSGEGIRPAIKSGRLAALAILAGATQGYSDTIWREIGRSHMLGVGLAAVFYCLPKVCFTLGTRNPLATAAFMDMLSDRAGYGQVIARLFTTLPIFLATEVAARLASWLRGPQMGDRLRALVYPGQ